MIYHVQLMTYHAQIPALHPSVLGQPRTVIFHGYGNTEEEAKEDAYEMLNRVGATPIQEVLIEKK